MRYSFTSSFKNLSLNWEKYVIFWEKRNFEPIMNSAHIAELLVLEKAQNKNIDYLLYYPNRQHTK